MDDKQIEQKTTGKVLPLKQDKPVEIRPVNVLEVYQVCVQMVDGRTDFNNVLAIDAGRFISEWVGRIGRPDYVLLGAFHEGKLIGNLGGMLTLPPHSVTPVGYTLDLFVSDQYPEVAEKLINSFRSWVKERGGKYVVVHFVHGAQGSGYEALYKKMNFVLFETQLIKEA